MIRLSNIANIIEKDWYEVSKSKYILYSLVGLPLILGILLPYSIMGAIVRAGSQGNQGNLASTLEKALGFSTSQWTGLTDLQKSIIIMSYLSDLLFLIIPLMVPIVIAADSIAGEKSRKSFEA